MGYTLWVLSSFDSIHYLHNGLCMCRRRQYVDRFALPYAIEMTSMRANRASTGDLVVTAAINDSSEDSDTENS